MPPALPIACAGDLLPPADRPDSAGTAAATVEAIEESRVRRQVVGTALPGVPSRQPAGPRGGLALPGVSLPGLGTSRATAKTPKAAKSEPGELDPLLRPGRAKQLCTALATTFREDPPVDCGRTNGRTAGQSCAFKDRYPKEVFSSEAVVEHLGLARQFWDPKPKDNVIRLDVPEDGRLVIVGDTHGQLEDVLWLFYKYGLPSKTNQYLFNGDIVDRGGHSLEILLLLFAFKRDEPSCMHMLRGNHEDVNCIIHFGFKAELESKFPKSLTAVWNACTNVAFPLMPIAALVSDSAHRQRFCVVHGGVPVGLPGQTGPIMLESDLTRITRQRDTVQKAGDYDSRVLYNLLWADPAETEQEKTTANSRADKFLENESREFCEKNGVSCIIRSHEVPKTLRGVHQQHGGLVYTVFSASNYTGSVQNRGGVLLCSGNPFELRVSEHWAPPWPVLAELLPVDSTPPEEHEDAIRSWEAKFGIGPESENEISAALIVDKAAAAAISSDAEAAGMDQRKQFMVERLVEHKEELFRAFAAADAQRTGNLPMACWKELMMSVLEPHCEDILTTEMLDSLVSVWSLSDPVEYVRFLHRFQIRDDEDEGSIVVDGLQAMPNLHRQLLDFSSVELDSLLDPDGDQTVTVDEFVSFLSKFGLHVAQWQAAALYETMSTMVDQHPITLDSAILCLALLAQRPRESSKFTDLCEGVGKEIVAANTTIIGAFRSWDTDSDGFLSIAEVADGLRSLATPNPITHEQVEACLAELSGARTPGKEISVSVFDFVQALASREMALEVQSALLREVLLRVWICRPLLLAELSQRDPDAKNEVTVAQFEECICAANVHLVELGLEPLTQVQMKSICEIASAGDPQQKVQYGRFVRGLHVEDRYGSSKDDDQSAWGLGSCVLM